MDNVNLKIRRDSNILIAGFAERSLEVLVMALQLI